MKYAWIETHSDLFSVSRMCRELGVSRTGYCQWRVRTPASVRSQCNAGCASRSDSRGDETQLRSAVHCAGSACRRHSSGAMNGVRKSLQRQALSLRSTSVLTA